MPCAVLIHSLHCPAAKPCTLWRGRAAPSKATLFRVRSHPRAASDTISSSTHPRKPRPPPSTQRRQFPRRTRCRRFLFPVYTHLQHTRRRRAQTRSHGRRAVRHQGTSASTPPPPAQTTPKHHAKVPPELTKPPANQVLIVPAIISLALFLVVTFAVLPLWRRYRNRYSQYLPLDSLSSSGASLRDRIANRLASLTLPSTWRQDMGRFAAGGGLGGGAGDSDGEELGDVDIGTGGLGGLGNIDTVRLSRE